MLPVTGSQPWGPHFPCFQTYRRSQGDDAPHERSRASCGGQGPPAAPPPFPALTAFYERFGFETIKLTEDGFGPGLHRHDMECPL